MSDLGALGNFKGVMLCNRPAQIPGSMQTIVGPTSTSGPTRPAFVSSVVADVQLGLPPAKGSHRVAARPDPTAGREKDVTWRHKKWLSEFAQRRSAIAGSMEARVAEQAERAKRFAERNQNLRDAIRGIKTSDADADTKAVQIEAALTRGTKPKFVPTEYVDVSQQYPTGAPVTHYDDEPMHSPSPPAALAASSTVAAPAPASSRSAAASASASKAKSKSSAAQSKPGWARTQAEDDDVLDDEADALLDFASGLDYQSYMDDLEVREALRFVQERVKSLQDAKQANVTLEEEQRKMIAAGELEEVWVVDESQPADAETGEPMMKKVVRRPRKTRQALTMADHESEWGGAQGGDQSERDRQAQQDALSKTVLESNRGMRNIHSTASVRALMDKEGVQSARGADANGVAAGTGTMRRGQQLPAIVDEEPLKPPVIATHGVTGGEAKKEVNPSNLPYLYRHPGI